MQEVIILRGLPASGKTTWAREYCKELPVYCRVSKDDIRAMLGVTYSKNSEETVCAIRDKMIKTLIEAGYLVIVDDTNINPKHISTINMLCVHLGVDCQVKDFDTPVDECIRRDAERVSPVGDMVIRNMDEQWHGKQLTPTEMDYLRSVL